MSASRTLLRRNPRWGETTDEEGGTVAKPKRTKPATPHRRVLFEERVGDHLHSYHATKGHRWLRQPA